MRCAPTPPVPHPIHRIRIRQPGVGDSRAKRLSSVCRLARPTAAGLDTSVANGTARTCTIIALTTPLVELASAQKRDDRDGGRWCVEQYKGVTHAKIIVGAMVSMDGVIQAPARYLR